MSEIPVPEEVANEVTNEEIPSGESSKPETEKNNNIEKLFEDFRNSSEYSEGLEKHKQGIKIGTSEEVAIKGYEAQMTTPEKPLVGTGEAYKAAFLHYVGDFYDTHGSWPLYFSEVSAGTDVSDAYKSYKDAAVRSRNVEGKIDVVSDANLDIARSDAHDKLAEIIYRQGRVKTFLDGKLVARMWLVSDNVEHPASITFMDKARLLRDFKHIENKERLSSD